MAAWHEEAKPVAVKDLALSAEVPGTTCRSLCAHLEELGIIELDSQRRYVGLVSPDAIRDAGDDLVARFEVLRREDERRLRAVVDYASGDRCRSAFIRHWFGFENPARCGRCDNCVIPV